jgi:hypothetical protein
VPLVLSAPPAAQTSTEPTLGLSFDDVRAHPGRAGNVIGSIRELPFTFGP